MAKTRVHELAKEFGVESKFVLEKLKEMGEFVKSASSTVEPPVEMRFKKQFGDELKKAAGGSAEAAPAPAARRVVRAQGEGRRGRPRPHAVHTPRLARPSICGDEKRPPAARGGRTRVAAVRGRPCPAAGAVRLHVQVRA